MDTASHEKHDNKSTCSSFTVDTAQSSSSSTETRGHEKKEDDFAMLHLFVLPDALFVDRILLYLGPRDALTTLGLVSKKFHHLATCKRVWQEFSAWRSSSSKLHNLATKTQQHFRYRTNGTDVFENRASSFLWASQEKNPLLAYARVHCSEWLQKKELISVSRNELQETGVATTAATVAGNDDNPELLVWENIRCMDCLRPALTWCNWPTCHNTVCESHCNQVREAEFFVRPIRFVECSWCKLRLCTTCCSNKMAYCSSCKRANCLDCANICCLGPTRSCGTQRRIQRGNVIRVIACFEQSCWQCAYKSNGALVKVVSREEFDALDKICCGKCASARHASVLTTHYS